MNTFHLLSNTMQKKVWEMGWSSFTPIQEKSIPAIINTKHHVIISSATASGKTEAAFLPILSLIEKEAKDHLKVIYISPLKALINNQFERIETLTESLEIPIHRWHGDITQSKKTKFTKNPNGILQITPESIESLFINRTQHLNNIFAHVEFIIIDEIHAFLDNERGLQLQSLLSRMETYTNKKPRIIGLSATLNNLEFVKSWVDYLNPNNVDVVESPTSDKELYYSLMHFQQSKDGKTVLELYEDLRDLTRDTRSIIFCNSRGAVEETTVFLNRLAEKEGFGESYYAHHSSIDKKEREFVEKTLTNSKVPKSVVATSSLELGIDIGSIEMVVQMDSTYTVSSLKQRLGRSGRTQDSEQYLQLYSTAEDGLIQSIAVLELNLMKWIEPAIGYNKGYDVLFHQIISICQESSDLLYEELVLKIRKNHAFHSLPQNEIQSLIDYMLKNSHLEKISGSNEIIVGIEGERILRSKEFYAVFTTEEVFNVFEGTRKIGELDKKFSLNTGDHVILNGKLWKVMDIDYAKNNIYVQKTVSAQKPKYYGGPVNLHPKIVEKMFEVLTNEETFDYINAEAIKTLNEARRKYKLVNANSNERIIWRGRDEFLLELFTGSKIVNTLCVMFRALDVSVKKPDDFGRLQVSDKVDIINKIELMKKMKWHEKDLMPYVTEDELFSSKFSMFIPDLMKINMHLEHLLDLEGTIEFLNKYTFRLIETS